MLILVVASCNKSKNEREVVINTVEQYALGMVHPDKDWLPDLITIMVTVRSKDDDGNFVFKEEICNQSKKAHNIDIKIQ